MKRLTLSMNENLLVCENNSIKLKTIKQRAFKKFLSNILNQVWVNFCRKFLLRILDMFVVNFARFLRKFYWHAEHLGFVC